VRFAEIALFAAPFLVALAWRFMAPSGDAPRILVLAVTAATVAIVGLLLVLWRETVAPPNAAYVPAQLVNGKIVPGRIVPPGAGEK
jgi:hypothetical protein